MKISLLLPYYERQEAANKALESLRKYKDIEIIVVDDGSKIPFEASEGMSVKVVRLPEKNEPKSPVTCWNIAAKEATGDILVLSCVEVIHEVPVIEQLTQGLGKDEYRHAAAWCPEEGVWHTHSTVEVPECPKGSAIGFCAAIHKELYWRAGGFDEEYRDGAGYEDRDFIMRLHSVGARFVKRDDLKVVHPKTGASIVWGAEKFSRNEALFKLKWPSRDPITFVCLNAGNYCGRGADYVNILADMVRRNMPEGVPWRFACLTDDPTGLDENISVIPLPTDLKSWWGKLYLFKRGLFEDGTRMVFFDLDTLIVDSLERILDYKGDMAILRDFYQPDRGAPGVILWKAGVHSRIWDEWEALGRPENPMGDLWWIESLDQGEFTRSLDRLQDLYPEMFVSYKASRGYVPKECAVVCFHGLPRPHQIESGWVPGVWKIGGYNKGDVLITINTENEQINRNIADACKRNIPWLEPSEGHGRHVCIVGGGPTLSGSVNAIRVMQSFGYEVWALNNVHDYLLDNGITPDVMVMCDAREQNKIFVSRPTHETRYYIASQCSPSVFDRLYGKPVYLYHNATAGAQEVIEKCSNKSTFHLIGGGTTVGMQAIALANFMGYRHFHLFGMDSCYMDGEGHAYPQAMNDNDQTMEVMCEGRTFVCAPWMTAQATDFQTLLSMLINDGCTMTISGDGFLSWIGKMMMTKQQELVNAES